MNDPKISIIVPIYNGENYISSFFNCISSQKYQNYEVLFIDDGSSDNTFDLCQKLTCRDQRIKIFRKKNGGPSSARNYGITHAEGEYLVFFDIDDEFSEDILFDNIHMAIQNDSDIVMWNFKMICMDLKQDIIRKIGQSFVGDKDVFFHSFLIPVLDNEMFNPPWNKLIKRQMLIDNNIRFDERFSIYEDILFSYKIMQKAEKISVNDNVYYDYIIKESGSLLTKFHSECFKAIMEIYDNSIKYAEMFAENNVQIERFKQQAVYLTKGYIKQVCMNKELSYQQKKEYLSEIANNNTFIIIYQNVMNEVKSLPAKFMIKNKMYKCLILYYHGLEMIR